MARIAADIFCSNFSEKPYKKDSYQIYSQIPGDTVLSFCATCDYYSHVSIWL